MAAPTCTIVYGSGGGMPTSALNGSITGGGGEGHTYAGQGNTYTSSGFSVTKEQWEALVATVKRLSADIEVLAKNGDDLSRALQQASRGERPVGYWEES